MEATVYDAFFVTVLKNLRFHLTTLENGAFQIDVFSKLSSFKSLHFHQRFWAF